MMRFVLGVLATACLALTPSAEQPNIVLILVDDGGSGDLSCYGSNRIATPAIDSIASAGVRFTQAYASSSVGGPARAGLLTGRYQQRFGFEYNVPRGCGGEGLPQAEATTPEGLGAAGYRSILVGKWHLGCSAEQHPLAHGFDDFFGFLGAARPYEAFEGDESQRLLLGREPYPESFAYLTTEFAQRAVAYIEEHADKRFFLCLAPNAVHRPLQARADLLTRARLDHANESDERQRAIALMMSVDALVNDVLTALAAEGLTENTLVCFAHDNGGASKNGSSNGALRGFKGSPYEGGVRVPLVMQWPAVLPAGRDFDAPVSLLDLHATAWSAAKLEPSAERPLDGVDLVPYLTGEREGRPHETLFWRRGEMWAIRHGDWKLLGYPGIPTPELFDLARDPGESTNRFVDEPELVDELRKRFLLWHRSLSEPAWDGQ
ncbi:MAG: sulfatase-like hydrolase/transferase [Planctomycetota bacterium]